MEKVDIFKREVTVYTNINDTEPLGDCTLLDILKDNGEKELIDKYRKSRKEEDKKALPVFTCSGVFLARKTNDGMAKHNGVVCIDIDKKDNLDVGNFSELKTLMVQVPYVAYCGLSCGGEGYFLLIPISNPEKHVLQYESICDDFERCNITVDRACKNVARTRYFSYDNNAYYNYEAVIYTRMKEFKDDYLTKVNTSQISDRRKQNLIARRLRKKSMSFLTDMNAFFVTRDIVRWVDENKIDITGKEPQWHQIGIALADEFGEFGRDFFHSVSKHHPKYKSNETNKKFDRCLTLFGYTIGTFFHYAEEKGYKQFKMCM